MAVWQLNVISTKTVGNSLRLVKGVGFWKASMVCHMLGYMPSKVLKTLSRNQVNKLTKAVDLLCVVESDLKQEQSANISRLISVGCYRGFRHVRKLPVRGQRTKTNASTCKKAATVASKRAAAAAKKAATSKKSSR